MRRCFCLMLSVLFLCSCQSSDLLHESKFEGGTLSVYIPNEQYKKSLQVVWEETYPQYKDQLHFVDEATKADIQYVMDEDVVTTKDNYLNMEDMTYEMQIPDLQKSNAIKDVFLPIQGEGMIFAYNKQRMDSYQVSDRQLQQFEKLVEIPDAYYHNHTYDYIYPFIFKNKTDVSNTTYDGVCEEITEHITAYLSWYQTMQISDNMLDQTTFFNKYLCGLLSSSSDYQQSAVFKKGDLHFTTMPSWNGEPLHPYITMYGFVIAKTTSVPNMAKGFLSMTRSKEGMQAFLDSNVGMPILMKEDIPQFTIYEHDKKEIIIAMNESQCKDLRVVDDVDHQTVFQRFLHSMTTSIIQNATKQEQDIEVMKMNLINDQEGLHVE